MIRLFKWLFILTVIVLVANMVAEWQMKLKVKDFLNRKVPDHIDFSYDNLDINLLKGSLEFEKIAVLSLGRQTSSCEIIINAEQLSIEGFSYWKIFFDKSIYIKSLTLSKPYLNFKTCPKDTETEATKANPIKLLKPIFIEELIFESGKVDLWNFGNELEILSVKEIDLNLKHVSTDPEIITDYIPFEFSEFYMTLTDMTVPLGKFEVLQMGSMELDNSTMAIKDISLATALSRAELSKQITAERDHINLNISDIVVNEHAYAIKNDTVQVFYESLSLNTPNLKVYRDKSVVDNYEKRPLYAELLRELPFKISIDTFSITKAKVVYEEDLPNDAPAGMLTFENMDVSFENFSNLRSTHKNLKVKLTADLMGNSSFNLDWEFDVWDPQKAFVISGGLSNLNTTRLNDFLVPNLRTKTTGTIEQLYFTISGDEYVASGAVKMNYEDFKFQVLNKERSQVKKILSFVGNLFVSDGSKADEDGYRHGTIAVERPKNKSFFNYLWVSLEDGLLDILTGNGKQN